ncbi:MAG TPA: phospho-N-acetylmuramoyl-pentapeptide-transferase [Ilumatobacteraceae bacterium]|nr:phospho-N-acetylmuramoyl-pentapeptide-transferase [Ilumatobacteraceae bacterium]
MIALAIASAIAAVVALFGTRALIGVLAERGASQPILQQNAANERVPPHAHKAGTPTMGGLVVVGAALAGYVLSHVRVGVVFSDQTLIIVAGILVMGGLGLIDDLMKVRSRQNRGVYWKVKGAVSYLMALVIAAVLVASTDIDTRISLTRADFPGWDFGPVVWVFWAGTIIFATTNAVNVTDGLDGLAAGSALFGFIAFTGMAFWALRNPLIYGDVVNPYDLAVLAAAFAGACAGFLWWNGAPAQIFMGDVGALALGSTLALLALATNTQLLLLLICGINVVEAGSVGLQMAVFRASGRRRRLFRLSPIHHHFEVAGWPETKVIIRFWLISGACVASAVAIFVADYTHQAALP